MGNTLRYLKKESEGVACIDGETSSDLYLIKNKKKLFIFVADKETSEKDLLSFIEEI